MANKKRPKDIVNEIVEEDLKKGKEDFECEEKDTIGGKMAYCRKSSELSLEEMSEYLGIRASQLYEYENDTAIPSLKFLFKFSQRFEIPMEKFVDDSIDFYDFAWDYDWFYFLRFRAIYRILYKKLKE